MVDEISPGEDCYAVDFPRARFVGDEDAVAKRSLFGDCTESLEVVLRCAARGFRLDCNFVVNDEVDFEVGARPPIGYLGVSSAGVDV